MNFNRIWDDDVTEKEMMELLSSSLECSKCTKLKRSSFRGVELRERIRSHYLTKMGLHGMSDELADRIKRRYL